MDSTGVISLLTDSSDRVHDLSGYFSKTLSDNRFWTYFKLIKSPADGHCLIHSIVTVLIFLNHNIQDHCTLFDKLKWECDNHHAKYLPDFIGTFDDFHYQMNQYIYNRVYDTGFCDLIPSILCNILNTTIVIIDKEICDYNVYVIHPFDKVPSDEVLGSFIDVSRLIILHRSGDHYDACVKVKSFEMFLKSLITLKCTKTCFIALLSQVWTQYLVVMKPSTKSRLTLLTRLFVLKLKIPSVLRMPPFVSSHTGYQAIHVIHYAMVMRMLPHQGRMPLLLPMMLKINCH